VLQVQPPPAAAVEFGGHELPPPVPPPVPPPWQTPPPPQRSPLPQSVSWTHSTHKPGTDVLAAEQIGVLPEHWLAWRHHPACSVLHAPREASQNWSTGQPLVAVQTSPPPVSSPGGSESVDAG
jgi:hypothetical protein